MNLEKMTNKTREALNGARQCAIEHANSELKNIHVLDALIQDDNGLANSILTRLGINRQLFSGKVDEALMRLPKLQLICLNPFFERYINLISLSPFSQGVFQFF